MLEVGCLADFQFSRVLVSRGKKRFCFLSTMTAMAALAYFTLEPLDYRGAAMPRGHFHSVTPP